MILKVVILMLYVFTFATGVKLPPQVKLCHKSDPNIHQCLAVNIVDAIKIFGKGNKDLGIPQLEPFFVEKIELNGDPTRSTSIEQKFENVYLFGGTNITLKNLHLDIDTGCGWEFDQIFPIYRMEADYKIKGQVLVLPINAQGKCNVTQYNLVNRNKMTCEKYTKKNATYLKITNYTMSMKADKIVYNFGDIFPGNERVSAEILKTINENALEIFEEVKDGFEKVFSLIYINICNNVFSKIPIDDIFLD